MVMIFPVIFWDLLWTRVSYLCFKEIYILQQWPCLSLRFFHKGVVQLCRQSVCVCIVKETVQRRLKK